MMINKVVSEAEEKKNNPLKIIKRLNSAQN
jgi:hypothetical protein